MTVNDQPRLAECNLAILARESFSKESKFANYANDINWKAETSSMLCHSYTFIHIINPATKNRHLFVIKSCNSSRTAPQLFFLGWLFPMSTTSTTSTCSSCGSLAKRHFSEVSLSSGNSSSLGNNSATRPNKQYVTVDPPGRKEQL